MTNMTNTEITPARREHWSSLAASATIITMLAMTMSVKVKLMQILVTVVNSLHRVEQVKRQELGTSEQPRDFFHWEWQTFVRLELLPAISASR